MKYPKMILFDYGNTLLSEPDFDTLRGEQALFRYIKGNKSNLSAKQINEFAHRIFDEIWQAREIGFEIHERQYQKFIYEYLGISFSISWKEAEKIFWDNTTRGEEMPGAGRMLDSINSKGIRSGVISNIVYSGEALTERINRLLPNNRFEFVIASSEYAFRKPSPMLFRLALKKSGLESGEVWYCGDNARADIEGAANAGIFPVWYEGAVALNARTAGNDGVKPNCAHLHIGSWKELTDVLNVLEREQICRV